MPRVSVSTRQTSEEAAEETRSEELPAKVMIWSETELKQKHVKQLGASACGATAVVNLLVSRSALALIWAPLYELTSLVTMYEIPSEGRHVLLPTGKVVVSFEILIINNCY